MWVVRGPKLRFCCSCLYSQIRSFHTRFAQPRIALLLRHKKRSTPHVVTRAMSAPDDEEEQVHWNDVMKTLLSYEEFVAYDLARRQDRINKLPAKYADRLPDCTFGKFEALQHACNGNQVIFEDMVQFHRSNDFGSRGDPAASGPTKAAFPPIPLEQQHRNIAVLHSLHREWSKEGEAERITTFKVLVDELKLRLPVTAENAYLQRVLVPGCGLGRLPLEIAAAGYACQGNEYSA